MAAYQAPGKPDHDAGYSVDLWKSEIERAKKRMRDWQSTCDKIVKRYRDERTIAEEQTPKFGVLWSNIQTLLPALYSRPPTPVVVRRYLERDPIGRIACQVLEQCLRYERDCGHLHNAAQLAITDYALTGRGQAWVRYEPVFESVPVTGADGAPVMGDDGEPLVFDKISRESIPIDYIQWKDFLHGPGRYWTEVPWVSKRVYLSREKLIELAGEEIGSLVPLNFGPDGNKNSETQTQYTELLRAEVYEIWCKDTKKVHWICADYTDAPLKELDDPLGLTGFFPCPEPVYSTRTTDALIPVPDYRQYQGQAVEMDDLSRRIDRLVAACKVVGTYDAGVPVLGRLLTEGVENDLIANENWAAFAQQGGLKGSVDFMPIEQYAAAIQQLMLARQQVKADIYEITGLADIIRGASDPGETATAQQIKGSYASLRLKDRQQDIQRFMRDVVRIQAEIICEHFQPETLWTMSGAQEMTEAEADPQGFQQKFMQAVQLLKDEKLRGFRIDIETDSTIAADEQQEQQSRVQFVESIGALLGQALPAVQQYPAIAPLLANVVLFAVRGFRVGRELESSFEEAVDQLERGGGQQAQKPDPEQQKAQLEQQMMQSKAQLEQQRTQAEHQLQVDKMQREQAIEQQKAQNDLQMAQEQHALEMQKMQAELAIVKQKFELEKQSKMLDMGLKERKANQDSPEGQSELVSSEDLRAEQFNQAMGQLSQGIAALAQASAANAAPKRVVRDQAGRVSHVESIQ